MRPVDNSIYNQYGDRWHTAYDDPIALLRAESKEILKWLERKFAAKGVAAGAKILDVGCGGGFLTNPLSERGFDVTGLDISPESLATAARHDKTGKVKYIQGDAYALPFPADCFDIVTSMDFLEHVEDPERAVAEMARVLKPEGYFYFHTFNRNPLAHLVIIKLVEWLVKNTPPDMHVIHLFIKPKELKSWCEKYRMQVSDMVGIRPSFRTIPLANLFSGEVPKGLKFKITKSTLLSYLGEAKKLGPSA
jgi:2-polyprenyl-6-hydroxyphenyl methylase/3-demethylubiquinone-9 3-methyltransferase